MPAEKRRRRERGSITVDQILTGAFEVAEQVTIDQLSMPLLAKHLDVGVTSIYWYFRRKDDLLDAMTKRAVAEAGITAPPIDAANWRESLERHAKTLRASFRTNPILCDLLLIRNTYAGTVSQAALHTMEQAVSALVAAGLPLEEAFATYSTVATHTRGSVILERLQEKVGRSQPRREDSVLDAATMPLIAEVSHTGHRIAIAGDTNFDYVLGCILDHATALIADSMITEAPATVAG